MKRLLKLTAAALLLSAIMIAHPVRAEEPTSAGVDSPADTSTWQTLFDNMSGPIWDGGDQDFSYFASNGLTYWCFGDSITNENNASGGISGGPNYTGNIILIDRDGVMTAATKAYPSMPDAEGSDDERYWDDGMFEANGYFYVLGMHVYNTSASPGFAFIGSDLGKFQIQPDGSLSPVSIVPTPDSANPGSGIGAANALFTDDALTVGGYVYIYGSTGSGVNPYIPGYLYVARVPSSEVETPADWTYWNGVNWVSGQSNATVIMYDSITSARYIDGNFVLTHMPYGPYGAGEVFAQVSSNPYGDAAWLAASGTPLFTHATVSGEATGSNYQTYYPQFHPEKQLADGKLLFSISRNSSAADLEVNDELYRPLFYEVSQVTLSIPTTFSSGAPYNINCKTSGQSVTVTVGGATAQEPLTSGLNYQQFQLISAGSGAYQIVNVGTSTSLFGYSSSRTFQLTSLAGGFFNIIDTTTGEALDNTGVTDTYGSPIVEYPPISGDTNQQWQIVPAR